MSPNCCVFRLIFGITNDLPPLSGLAQAGNSCFLATGLQMYFHSSSFPEVVVSKRRCCCASDTCPSCIIALTYASVARRGEAGSLELWKPFFNVMHLHFGFQQDAHKFWRRFLDRWESLSGYCSQLAAFDHSVFVKDIRKPRDFANRKKGTLARMLLQANLVLDTQQA